MSGLLFAFFVGADQPSATLPKEGVATRPAGAAGATVSTAMAKDTGTGEPTNGNDDSGAERSEPAAGSPVASTSTKPRR